MKILFVLPCTSSVPLGGFKIVYEYSNRLSARGYEVSILHPLRKDPENTLEEIKSFGKYLLKFQGKRNLTEHWFKLDPKIKFLTCPSLSRAPTIKVDTIIATAWGTAEFVAKLPDSSGKKYYLIQSYENWDGPEERVRQTWKLPLKKIVISRWLLNIASQMNESATLIPFGLDPTEFGVDILPEDRSRPMVGMLFHRLGVKGTQDGMQALHLIHQQIPDLTARLFGVYPKPQALASWMNYEQLPTRKQLRDLYNSCQIFLAPSRVEGLGVPPLEAMLCGASLVATRIGGHSDYAEEMATALLAPPGQPEKLAERALELLLQPTLRTKLAYAGRERAQQFNWEEAVLRLESLLLQG